MISQAPKSQPLHKTVRLSLYLETETIEEIEREAGKRTAEFPKSPWKWRELAACKAAVLLDDWAQKQIAARAAKEKAVAP